MKSNYYTLFLISLTLLSIKSISQTVQTGIGTTTVEQGVALQLQSDDKGLLIPSVSLTSRSLTAPLPAGIPMGTTVFNTNTFGSFPNEVVPGFYYWDNVENLWKVMSENDLTVSAKFFNADTSVNLYTPTTTTPVNMNLMGFQQYNENPDIIKKLNDSQIQIGSTGLYEVTVNVAFAFYEDPGSDALGMAFTLRLDGAAVGTTHYVRTQGASLQEEGKNSSSFTEFIQINDGQILTITSVRATPEYNVNDTVVRFENGYGFPDEPTLVRTSSLLIKRIK